MNPFAETNSLEAAMGYHGMGFALIPCTGKKPAISTWQQWQHQRPDTQLIAEWFTATNQRVRLAYNLLGNHGQGFHSIGVVLGAVSENRIVIDLDGHDAVTAFYEQFPDAIGQTLTIATGSGKGRHLYYQVAALPRNMNVRLASGGGVEIRGNGQYVIAPPSLHPDTQRPYVARGLRSIATLDNIDPIVDWLQAIRLGKQQASNEQLASAATPQQVRTSAAKQHYLETVVAQELARIETATEGTRNNALFYAALRLANFCAGGELYRHDMESRLAVAASAALIPSREAQRTIDSAFRIGMKHPKQVKV